MLTLTTINEVEKALLTFTDNQIAKKWLHNDLAKKKIANSYDDWISDIHDHHLFLTLIEHIETCLDTPQYIEHISNPAN